MKERPVLFSGSMVRAILSGSKSQTRRVVKHKWPHLWQEPWYATGRVLDDLTTQPGSFMEFRHRSQDEAGYAGSPASTLVPCPYGQPGDRLWVRESFRLGTSEDCACYDPCDCKSGTPIYRASGDQHENEKWKPSIHMPRWACRIVLEIVSVRVERLQGISLIDAEAEGIVKRRSDVYAGDVDYLPIQDGEPFRTPVEAYRALWESINGPESWNANPWVWVVEFNKVKS